MIRRLFLATLVFALPLSGCTGALSPETASNDTETARTKIARQVTLQSIELGLDQRDAGKIEKTPKPDYTRERIAGLAPLRQPDPVTMYAAAPSFDPEKLTLRRSLAFTTWPAPRAAAVQPLDPHWSRGPR